MNSDAQPGHHSTLLHPTGTFAKSYHKMFTFDIFPEQAGYLAFNAGLA